jgi:hypothetical protein
MDAIPSHNILAIDTWNRAAEFYQALVLTGHDLSPMVQIIENVAASQYAEGIYGTTSMVTLCISQHQEINWNRGEVLRVDLLNDRFIFTYKETPLSSTEWKKECESNYSFSTFEHVMRRLKWFVDLK